MKRKPVTVEETSATYTTKKVAVKGKAGLRKPTAPIKIASRTKRLELDAEELALHAEISSAVARDLGR